MPTFALDRGLRERWTPAGERWTCTLPTGWMQGRAVYGGLSGAMALALARRVSGPRGVAGPEGLRARHVQLSLVRPATPGPIWGGASVLRAGRSVTSVTVELGQGDAIFLHGTVTFVSPRVGTLAVDPALRPPSASEPAPRPIPRIPGVTPEFIQHVDLQLVRGELPFSGAPDAMLVGDCRFRVPAGDEEGLLALSDVWPCPSLARLRQPAAASTVTWSTHLLAAPARLEGFYRMHYRTLVGRVGFHTARGELYDPAGALVAVSEQLVAVFDEAR